jgi:hypothetical protein
MYGLQKVADIFAWYAKESDASSLDVLFNRFFGYLTENLHLKRVDQSAASSEAPERECKPVDPASATKVKVELDKMPHAGPIVAA